MTVFRFDMVLSSWTETPKSASFATALSVRRMLPDLIS